MTIELNRWELQTIERALWLASKCGYAVATDPLREKIRVAAYRAGYYRTQPAKAQKAEKVKALPLPPAA